MSTCSPPSPEPTSTRREGSAVCALRRLACLGMALLAAGCASISQPTRPITDLSVAVVPSQAPGDSYAVWYSGDAGWGATDQAISARLAALGLPVVGISSRRYFWHRRTPEAAAADLDALAARYAGVFGREKLVVVGYSFGGAAAPLIVQHASPATRARLRMIVLVAPSQHAQLVVRPWTWLEIPGPGATPTTSEVAAVAPVPVICIYGVRDSLAACPLMPAIPSVKIESGHLFRQHYDDVVDAIAKAIRLGRPDVPQG